MAVDLKRYPPLSTDPPILEGIDPLIPTAARLYDYYLGGTYNYPSGKLFSLQLVY